ncbi:MAG TPA: CPBP family glutamic-type intramembrane protease, partial [Candidatus Acidoferrales bacterium]|nr:CPBP family glutamic-type intramembrane protease [Candidatus Acidoferrales bacterium]
TLLSTLNTALAGLLLATARLRSRALWMPIGLHFAWNLFLGPVFSFPVSGYAFGAAGTSSPPAVPPWLSGGAYGPEGSAALTGILVAAILLLLRLPLPIPSPRTRSELH